MPSTPSLPIERILATLADTPRRLAALDAALTPAQLRTPPAPGEWSISDTLAHLRSCSDVWGRAIATILAGESATLRAINPLKWIESTNYPDLAFSDSLRAYTAQRADLLALLKSLAPAEWARSITVTGAGAPLTRTVHDYGDRLARHDRAHHRQL